MQLEKKSFAVALSVAAGTLLSANAQASGNDSDQDWQFETAVMYYGETERVQALEGIFSAQTEFNDQQILNLKLTVDTLTGASANGAIAQSKAQTFTRPSGKGQYQVKPGEIPLDDTFRDSRVQVNGQWTQPLGRLYSFSGGLHLSNEYDYLALGANGRIARDFNNRNTTLFAGMSLAMDFISPEGGLPKARKVMPNYSQEAANQNWDDEFAKAQYQASRSRKDDEKRTVDMLFGLTQVINKNLITQLNYSYSQVDGYMTDPFKVVSVVDEQGVTTANLYESRPDSRKKNSVFTRAKYYLSGSVVDLSYRHFWDSWDVTSNTIDFRYWLPFEQGGYIEPHIRYYRQQEANFYKPLLSANEEVPMYMSADYRVGNMSATTLGLKYGHANGDGTEWSMRLEWYHQASNEVVVDLPSGLVKEDVYADVDAVILQFTYKF